VSNETLGREKALFAARGHKRVINQGIGQLRDIKSAQRDATLSADEWARHESTLRELEARIGQLTERMQGLTREKSRLERLKRVLPLFAERDDVHRRLAELGGAILLPPDFSKRRQVAETALHSAQQNLDRAVRDFEEHEELVATLGPTPTLAAESESVTAPSASR
jgi:predicted nuclease with TOPRIM domain